MKIVSLFSGAGGLDLGLIQAGSKIVWANDIDKDAFATYSNNIGNHIVCADIKDVAITDIPT
jgi:DNA (cytosine-5)-methyltransferase 1